MPAAASWHRRSACIAGISLAIVATALLDACASGTKHFDCPRFAEFRYRVDDDGGGRAPGLSSPMAPLMSAMSAAMATASARTGKHSDAPPPHTVLVLSGGGPWDAFGAGFLAGWSGARIHPRPIFDLVTGVSTGALQATDAFLGPERDAQVAGSYAIDAETDLITRRGTLGGVFTGAFADTAPLERRLRVALAPLYDRVAAAGQDGRLLLVGAVDALDGEMYAIDLTAIARILRGRVREECYVGALMASAAVPVEFDRVEVGGRPYFDGGVRRSVFVADIQRAASAMPAGPESALYILVNGDRAAEPVARLAEGLLPTLARLRTLAVNQIEVTSIADVAHSSPAGFTTFIASAAGQRCGASDEGHDVIFAPRFMACLEAEGRRRWDGGDPWTRAAAGMTSNPAAPMFRR